MRENAWIRAPRKCARPLSGRSDSGRSPRDDRAARSAMRAAPGRGRGPPELGCVSSARANADRAALRSPPATPPARSRATIPGTADAGGSAGAPRRYGIAFFAGALVVVGRHRVARCLLGARRLRAASRERHARTGWRAGTSLVGRRSLRRRRAGRGARADQDGNQRHGGNGCHVGPGDAWSEHARGSRNACASTHLLRGGGQSSRRGGSLRSTAARLASRMHIERKWAWARISVESLGARVGASGDRR